jgi:hypothetical protein
VRIRKPGVNFTDILQAAFSSEIVLHSFFKLQYGFVFFCEKNIGAKAADKMLLK